jgi:uncharacterized membrane protein YqjE
MADQATMKTANGPWSTRSSGDGRVPTYGGAPESRETDPGASSVVSSVAGFSESLLNLAELQAQLYAIELRKNAHAARNGGVGLLAGLALAVASLPVALVGIAELMVAELALKRAYALLIVAGAALLFAVGCVASAGLWLRRQRIGFPLSGEELNRNVNWVRTVLAHSGRSTPHR